MAIEKIEKSVLEYNKRMISAKSFFLKELNDIDKDKTLTFDDRYYAYSRLNPAHVTTEKSSKIGQFSVGASFKILLTNFIMEKKYYKKYKIALGSNDKVKDSRFVAELGFDVPKVYTYDASAKEAIRYVGCIVKPRRGASSKGVFVISKNGFYHLYDRQLYQENEFLDYCDKNRFKEFIVEEYVGGEEEVRDLKFYTFYGEIGLVLEIKRMKDGNRHCFYNSEGDVIDVGRYDRTLFKGNGFSETEKQYAIEVSRAIPSPFVRVDLISGEKGSFVGEITAHPGGFENFNQKWDVEMGELFIKARARLIEDLISGKQFSSYFDPGL